MNKSTVAYRHGDVILKKRAALPDGRKKSKLKRRVLAEGEVTGHRHQVSGDAVLYKIDDVLWLDVGKKGAAVTHEEHKKIELQEGVYEIGIQREYEPDGWRQVQD